MALGKQIRKYREKMGWTLEELEEKSGVQVGTIHALEQRDSSRSKFAVALARAFELTTEQLIDDTKDWIEENQSPFPSTRAKEDEHLIPRFDVAARMGDSGYITEGHVGVITRLKVDSEWLRNNLKGYTSTKNLGVVTGFGESMKPLFNPGDPLIIDMSVVEFIGDFPYLFRIGNELFIKRIQRVPGSGFIALSDNRNYRDWPITPEMDFAIIGKVIKVWRSEDF